MSGHEVPDWEEHPGVQSALLPFAFSLEFSVLRRRFGRKISGIEHNRDRATGTTEAAMKPLPTESTPPNKGPKANAKLTTASPIAVTVPTYCGYIAR